jgi:hypothetical protein
MIREVLSYYILGYYMIAPRANFAQVYINGDYKGLYSNTESISKSFCSANFNSSGKTFIKCSPYNTPSPLVKSNLKFIPGADSSAYFNLYELKSTQGWNELVALCNIVTNQHSEIANVMNMDKVLWMLAFNSLLVNLDSYTGVFAQNYYLYKDGNNLFNPIVWDLNMSFGGFPFVGSSNTSMGGLTIAQMQQLSPTVHAGDPYWPLINAVMNNPAFRKIYFAHLRTMASEMFAGGQYITFAENLQQLIDTAVQSDANKFFSYEQFLNGMNTNYPVLNYQVPGIQNLMDARLNYLQNHAEFSAAAPEVLSVLPMDQNPDFNDEITIQAEVLNAASVFLGYRLNSTGVFELIIMEADDKKRGSKNAENIYTATFLLNSAHAQYYVVAFNDAAASFSPPRAEYDFFQINAVIATPAPGEVMINEFLAKNDSGVQNEYGEYADWIELYNITDQQLSLFGLFLTDDANNLTKFAFPENAVIAPGDYLIIFADDMPSTDQFIHCNFKLSADGEVIIMSNASGQVIDSVSFGPQTGDVSMGRCPNGAGDFVFLNQPSFGALNICPAEPLNIITKWDFNNESLVPSIGNGTAINLGNTTYTWGNGVTGSPDLGWNTANYPPQATNSATAGVEFRVSMAGYKNLQLSYYHRNSGTASRFAGFFYTLNGTDWIEHGIYANGPPHDQFNQYNWDFTSISQVDNNPDFGIRILAVFSPEPFTDPQEPFTPWGIDEAYRATRNDRNYASTGTWRFDDVIFSGDLLTGIMRPHNSIINIRVSHQQMIVNTGTEEPFILEIFNLMGQALLRQEFHGRISYEFGHSLSPSVYIARFTGAGSISAQKFVVY